MKTPLAQWLSTQPSIQSLDLSPGFPRLELLLSLVATETTSQSLKPRLLCTLPGDGIVPPLTASDGLVMRLPLSADMRSSWLECLVHLLEKELDSSTHDDEIQRCILSLAERLQNEQLFLSLWDRAFCYSRVLIIQTDGTTKSLMSPGGFLSTGNHESIELRSLQAGENALEVQRWFEQRWSEAQSITKKVTQLVLECWACAVLSPLDAYQKALIEYFATALEVEEQSGDPNPVLERMADFQREAYFHAKGILRRFGGVFISDVVGLGKTYIGLALISYMTRQQHSHVLLIAPPRLLEMWKTLLEQFRLNATLISSSSLKDLPSPEFYDVVLIDESHNFRNHHTQRYQALQRYLRPEGQVATKRVILLTATPQNNRCWDVYHQLRLFPDIYSQLPVPSEGIKDFFKLVEDGKAELSSLLQHVVVRRTRSFVKREYPGATLPYLDKEGNMQRAAIVFPDRRVGPDLVLRYSIEDVYGGLYDQVIHTIFTLTYARYGLGDYLSPELKGSERYQNLSRGSRALRGLFKALLLKRLESSLAAFRRTLRWIVITHQGCLDGISQKGVVLTNPRYRDDDVEELDVEDALSLFEGEFPLGDFDSVRLAKDIQHDLSLLQSLHEKLERIPVEHDAKLLVLLNLLTKHPPRKHKMLIFTQFAATATYLYENLKFLGHRLELITGSRGNQNDILRRFSPRSMGVKEPPESPLDLLISTDILSEGINLQDADTIINYDLHWNPVRLIQRSGRIDRIGSQHSVIHIYNFLPETALERVLGLESVLRRRIAEILKVFGDDNTILPLDYGPPDETSVLDIYTGKVFSEADDDPSLDGLSVHLEEVFRLRRLEPLRFERLKLLRPAQRAILHNNCRDAVIMCQAGWLKRFYQVKVADQTPTPAILDDREALDRLKSWSQSLYHVMQASLHSGLNAATRLSSIEFGHAVLNLIEQRFQPKLSAAEDNVCSKLIQHRYEVPPSAWPEIDRMIQWVRRGRFKVSFEATARKWRRESLPGASIRQELRSWLAHYPIEDEQLPDGQVVVSVLGD